MNSSVKLTSTTIQQVFLPLSRQRRSSRFWMGGDAIDGHCFHRSEEGNLCFDVVRMRVLMAVVEDNLAMIFLFL